MTIEIEYRSEGGPGLGNVGYRTRWRATCPAVPGFRTLIDRKLRNSMGSALHELGKQDVDPNAVIVHVLVDTDGERYEMLYLGLARPKVSG